MNLVCAMFPILGSRVHFSTFLLQSQYLVYIITKHFGRVCNIVNALTSIPALSCGSRVYRKEEIFL